MSDGKADSLNKEKELKAMLTELLDAYKWYLTEREDQVLRMRFGLYDGRYYTLQEVADLFGITPERVRQIEMKLLRRHSRIRRVKKIEDFYC